MDSKGNRESEETKAKYVQFKLKLDKARAAKASLGHDKRKKKCIYKAPWCLRGQGNQNRFKPHLVSIGPYHHKDSDLERMQFHKYRMLDVILMRTGKDIREFCNAIENLEHEARDCYTNLPEERFRGEQFVELLVRDGCFILDFLVGLYAGKKHTELGYEEDDPIFCKLYMRHGILMDMILLENQIPLFILDKLYEIQFNPPPHDYEVVDLIFLAFDPSWVTGTVPKSKTELLSSSKLGDTMPGSCLEAFWQNLKYDPAGSKPKSKMALGRGVWESMMELVKGIGGYMMALGSQESTAKTGRGNQESMADQERGNQDYMTQREESRIACIDDVPNVAINSEESIPTQGKGNIKGAPDKESFNVGLGLKQHVVGNVISLKEAGVVFKHKKGTPFWACKFDRGVMEIPQIVIAEWSESVFLSLMAFELRHMEEKEYRILPYVLFMDSLVNFYGDVRELRASGVIVSSGLSNKELADTFNRLGGNPMANVYGDEELIKNINEYCNRRIHRWRANLMRNYFNNPWAIISVVAAAFLMLLTFAQTYYTIAPYYQSP